jgi:hypothetical protein
MKAPVAILSGSLGGRTRNDIERTLLEMAAWGGSCVHVMSRHEGFDTSGGRIEFKVDLSDHRSFVCAAKASSTRSNATARSTQIRMRPSYCG